jgi:AcrR family transcriptional regulator
VARLRGVDRREQVLEIAAEEFAAHGLHGVSAEAIARRAGITHAYVFHLFGSKKSLFLAVVRRAFDRMTENLRAAAGDAHGLDALERMGWRYVESLTDKTLLLLQLQAFAACGDREVRDAVRESFGRMWHTVGVAAELEPVQVKTFLAYGMLLNTNAALDLTEVDEPWAEEVRTRIRIGLFEHITSANNRDHERPAERRDDE